MSLSTDALRHRLQQLQALHDSGELGAQALADARAPLERELVERVLRGDAPVAGAATVAPARPSRRLQGALTALVLVLAVAGYLLTGSPQLARQGVAEAGASDPGAAADGSAKVTEAQVQEMLRKLSDRLKEQPDDAVGWTMLARAHSAMGRFDDAVPAFRKALALTGDQADLLADLADALATQNDGKLGGEPMALVRKALALEPGNLKALALSGSAAFDERDFAGAVRQWEQVEQALPAGSNFQAQVRASIAQARELAGLPAAVRPPAGEAVLPSSAASAAATAAAPGSSLGGSVSLAPSLAGKADPTDTVFILARAASGPRMPLAVLRKQVKDLPLRFSLDDSMAMAPTAKISNHALVVVSARISKDGDAIAKPGDPSGESAPVAPGTAGIVIEIGQATARQ